MLGVETTVVLILRGNEGNWCESRQDPQAQSSLLSCWAFHLASDGGILPQVLLVEGQTHWRWLMHHRLRVWLGYGFRVTRRDRLRCLSVFHRGSRTHGLFRFTHIQAEFNV